MSRVVLAQTRNGGHLRATRLFVRRARPGLYFNRVPSLPATDDGSASPLAEDLRTRSGSSEDITWDADAEAGATEAGVVPEVTGADASSRSTEAEPRVLEADAEPHHTAAGVDLLATPAEAESHLTEAEAEFLAAPADAGPGAAQTDAGPAAAQTDAGPAAARPDAEPLVTKAGPGPRASDTGRAPRVGESGRWFRPARSSADTRGIPPPPAETGVAPLAATAGSPPAQAETGAAPHPTEPGAPARAGTAGAPLSPPKTQAAPRAGSANRAGTATAPPRPARPDSVPAADGPGPAPPITGAAGAPEERDAAARRRISRRAVLQASLIGGAGVAALPLLALVGGMSRSGEQQPTGLTYSMNTNWLFGGQYMAGSESSFYDDSDFAPIAVPHAVSQLSWQNWDVTAWQQVWIYRRHFNGAGLLGPHRPGSRIFIDFDGVMVTRAGTCRSRPSSLRMSPPATTCSRSS